MSRYEQEERAAGKARPNAGTAEWSLAALSERGPSWSGCRMGGPAESTAGPEEERRMSSSWDSDRPGRRSGRRVLRPPRARGLPPGGRAPTRQLLIAEAKREAEALRREAEIEAREEAVQPRSQVEGEVRQRQTELVAAQERTAAKEAEAERRTGQLERREQGVADREVHTKQLQEDLKAAKERQVAELERIGGMTLNEAKAHLLERSEELVRHELARRVRQMEEEAQTEAKPGARNLVADALQRVAASHAAETTGDAVE